MRPVLRDSTRREQPRPIAGRLPPHDLDAELEIVAHAIEHHGIAEARTVLADDGSDFYSDENGTAWAEIVACADEHGGHVELALVRTKLIVRREWPERQAEDLFSRIACAPSIASRVRLVAQHVRRLARARSLITMLERARAELYDVADLDGWVGETAPQLEAALHDALTPKAAPDVVQLSGERFAVAMSPPKRQRARLGIEALDEAIVGGLEGLTLVTAARNGGKSSFLAHCMVRLFADNVRGAGDRGVLFSLEMSPEEYADLVIANLAEIDSRKLREPERLTDEERSRWAGAIELERSRGRYNVGIYDRRWKSYAKLATTVRGEHEACKRQGRRLRFVGIDHVQLLKPWQPNGGRGFSNHEEELDAMTEQLKELSAEIDAPIIALSQINAAGQARGSRAIEAHADNIFRLKLGARSQVFDAREANITIEKQRRGEQGAVVPLWFFPQWARFS